MSWRRLVERTTGWTPELYAPLRVVLSPDEAHKWAAFLPQVAAGEGRAPPSLVAGAVQRRHLELLGRFPDVFDVREDEVVMHSLGGVDARTKAFHRAEAALRAEGFFKRWQDELYAARPRFSSPALFTFHRGVGGLFGLAQFATHLNGFVRSAASASVSASASALGPVSHIWVATRSATKNRWPSLLDSVVGGGLPAGISARDNMVKEAQEEAGLEPAWTRERLVATGSFTYVLDERNGLKNNTMFFFDLELPRGVQPVNQDGEVAKFELWPVEDVLACLWDEPERFKPDVCVLLLDFFVRHGILTADSFPDYEDLVFALRGSPSPYDPSLWRV